MKSIYANKSPSKITKLAFVVLLLAVTCIVCWYLLRDLASNRHAPGSFRRVALSAASVLYFLRTLLAVFVFLRRRMGWPEVFTVAPLLAAVEFAFAYVGAHNAAPFGVLATIGLALILAGSVLNTGSEWQRYLWKRRPENAGHLLTTGFGRLSRHVNYFGDVVLFAGWAMLAGSAVVLLVPALMLAGFAFVHVPAQDRYLERRYGDEYRAYAQRTPRLIPFLY